MGVLEFWDLTPAETWAAIDAGIWQLDHEHRRQVWLAWHIAALTRSKRLPSLQQMLGGGDAKKLEGDELERRQREHDEMARGWQKTAGRLGRPQRRMRRD